MLTRRALMQLLVVGGVTTLLSEKEAEATINLLQVTDANFQAAVIERSKTKPVVVEFWAEWCKSCKFYKPQFAAVAQALKNDFVFAECDQEKSPNTAGGLNITALPCTIVLDGGKPVLRMVGGGRAAEVEGHLKNFLKHKRTQKSR
ncbi:hypothetical protein IPJ72_07190 [Candidatus Peregrinibacteria bacterium]|nr:MAG: hypothetical protein IPJ72_07190 [Candidatus Peregrinibacteria bacterium]